jgi:hypothetical protein
MTPRQLVALIDQWKEIEKNRDILKAFVANGGDLNEVGHKEAKITGDQWLQL